MKTFLSLLSLALAWGGTPPLKAADQLLLTGARPSVEQEVMKLADEFARAYVNRDVEAIKGIEADDFIGIDDQGDLFGKEQELSKIRSGEFKVFAVIHDEPAKVRVHGTTAIRTYCATFQQEYLGKDTSGQYRGTEVWVKRDGRWQLFSYHGSKVVKAQIPAPQGSIERNKQVLLQAHREVWSAGNLNAVPELYDEGFVCHFNAGISWKGIDGVKGTVKECRSEYPDWCETVNQIIAEGDFVVTRWTSTGTYGGTKHPDLVGRKVSLSEMAVHRFKNGKIVEQWGIEDSSAYKKQLGRDIYY